MDGIFITLEGPDGAGKTTALNEIAQKLAEETNRSIVTTREPGGSPIAEKIREIILDTAHTEMDERTEALLYAASRRQHLVEKVIPVLELGGLILCDRFVDSSVAYQGFARGIGEDGINQINAFATGGMQPDMTLYIDIEPAEGLRRIALSDGSRENNRLDQEAVTFHEKVRTGYLHLLEKHADRIVRIEGKQLPDEVVRDCMAAIQTRFPAIFK